MDIATVKEKHEALRKLIHDAILDFQDETGCQVSLVVHTREQELIIDLATVIE